MVTCVTRAGPSARAPRRARDVAPEYVGQDLRKLHGKSQIRGRTHLRAAEAPSAQIRRGSALETDTPERTA